MIVLKDGLIPTRTVGEETFWRVWRHDYDIIVTWSHRWRHHSTAPGQFPTGSQYSNKPPTGISLSFRYTTCPEKRSYGIIVITLTNLDTVS